MGDMTKCEKDNKIISAEFCSVGKCSDLRPKLILVSNKNEEEFCIGALFCLSKVGFAILMLLLVVSVVIVIFVFLGVKAKGKKSSKVGVVFEPVP